MKIPVFKTEGQTGNVLVVTLFMTALVGFALASYLTLVKSQNLTTMRSQAWNSTIPVIEAGLEDALAHLNENGTNRLDIDGWQKSGNVYYMRRYFRDAYYIVSITNWFGYFSPMPIVESRGYVRMPVQVVQSKWDTLMAAVGAPGTPYQGFLIRGVRAYTRRSALFSKGLVAKGQINLNGNNIATDSFDSTESSMSTDGLYDPLKASDNGHVATNSGLTNSLNIGNANIKGKVATGPGGSLQIGPGGIVGSQEWHDAKNKGIEPGASSDDMNVDFPEIQAPFSGGAWMPGPGSIDGVTYDYILNSGNYILPSINMASKGVIKVVGDAVLYVTGDILMEGQAYIEIDEGASLQIFAAGTSVAIGGLGVLNKSGYATNFAYFGLPSNKYLSLAGNGTFTGVIYAPEADLFLQGSGRDVMDVSGASITKTVTMDGSFNFHYDEALNDWGPARGYIVTEWSEMKPAEVVSLSFEPYFYSDGDDGYPFYNSDPINTDPTTTQPYY